MATQELEQLDEDAPLSPKQLAFARELGPALARGGRDDDLIAAYEAAGYKPDRGNARRLAADPRVRKIAEEALAEANRLSGLHIGYLQAKALELLQASATRIHRALSKTVTGEIGADDKGNLIFHPRLRDDLTEDEQAEIDAATWALSEFKIDEKGVITVKLPDKKALIEMLSKQLGVGKDDNSTTVNLSLEQLIAQSMQKDKAA